MASSRGHVYVVAIEGALALSVTLTLTPGDGTISYFEAIELVANHAPWFLDEGELV